MPKNIQYVTCPSCKGLFYVTAMLYNSKEYKCFCPFCKLEFKPKE